MKYNLVVCGGTFDHFHKGHIKFLLYALSICNRLLIGLTTDRFISNKEKDNYIEDYKTRKKQLEDFFVLENAIDKVSIEPIDDIYIPKIWESLDIEAIVVSRDTIKAAKKINLKRKEQGKYPLSIETVDLIESGDNKYISSSRIRNGEINREGKLYVNPLWLKQDLIITDNLRAILKKPFGSLIKNSRGIDLPKHSLVITVGDATAKAFNDLSKKPDISAIDFKIARKKIFKNIKELGFEGREDVILAKNPSGYLTPSLFREVISLFTPPRRIKVLFIDGEDDLCVLPLVLAAPLGSVVFYGQPKEGVVKINVSENNKEKAYELVNQFRIKVD